MHVAKEDRLFDGYEIAEVDAEGIGQVIARVNVPTSARNPAFGRDLARVLVLALDMDGGVSHALKLLRAETIKQRA